MADTFLTEWGGTAQTLVKQRMVDNGDGTYSLAVSSASGGTASVGSLAAGENHIGEVGGHTTLPAITFSLDTSAYTAGDVLADTQALASSVRTSPAGKAVLESIVLNDKDDQGADMNVVLLSANVSLGTENSAPSLSDANGDSVLGVIPVSTGDWVDFGGCRIATLRGLGLVVASGTADTSVYVGLVNGAGTPTYTASGITGRFGFMTD